MMDDSELLKYWEETSKEYKHGSNAEQCSAKAARWSWKKGSFLRKRAKI